MTYTCVCGDAYTETIAKTTDHTYAAVVTAPTCSEQGFTTYTCECGDSYIGDYVAKLAHTEVLINKKAATATEDGYTGDIVCSVCGAEIEKGEVIAATGEGVNNCSHMCHKDGFFGFIWKIINFFQKLFGINPVCECGERHY